jgi:hypothetical protein
MSKANNFVMIIIPTRFVVLFALCIIVYIIL